MLNSGAIMISAVSLCELHPEMRHPEKFDYMQNYLEVRIISLLCLLVYLRMYIIIYEVITQRIAGNQDMGFDNSIFLSERDSADRNFAMAYFMKEHKCFPDNFNLQECMDLYFQVKPFPFNTLWQKVSLL